MSSASERQARRIINPNLWSFNMDIMGAISGLEVATKIVYGGPSMNVLANMSCLRQWSAKSVLVGRSGKKIVFVNLIEKQNTVKITIKLLV